MKFPKLVLVLIVVAVLSSALIFGFLLMRSNGGLVGFYHLDDIKATDEGTNSLVLANNRFAVDYYSKLSSDPKNEGKNIFFSPFIVSAVFSMVYEGASGLTAQEIRRVFYFPENDIERRSSFARIYNKINEGASKGNYSLSIANGLWIEKAYGIAQNYNDVIKNYYYGKVTLLDFNKNYEDARIIINTSVEEATRGKIVDLLPSGSVSSLTKMVITSAIYFKGDWAKKFDKKYTHDANFFVSEEKKLL